MIKKTMSIAVVLMMLLGLLAGCATDSTTTANTTAGTTTAGTTTAGTTAAATIDDTTYDISFMANKPTAEDTYVEQLVEEALNVNITVPLVDWQDPDRYNLIFSSGEMPDCGFFTKDTQYLYYDQELVRTIPMDMIKTYCPSFVALYDSDPLFWAYVTCKEDETQAYGLPAVSETNTQMYIWTDFYRYDWIQDLNLDMGVEVTKIADNFYVTEGGVPIDNFETILRAFKTKGTDIIPASWNGGIPADLLSAFGLISNIVNNNGVADQYYVTDAYRACLEWLAGLYAEGLIDKEVPTQDRSVWWDKVNNSQVGYFCVSSNALNSWAIARPPLSLWAKDDTIPIVMTPGVADSDGNYVSPLSVADKCNGHMFFVNANVTDEGKLARILQLVEYVSFPPDTETTANLTYGKEGVNWEWSEEKDDWAVKIATDPVIDNGGQYFNSQMQVGKFWDWLTFEPLFEAGSKYYIKANGGVWNTSMQYPYVTDILNETDIIQLNKDYAANVATVVDEFRNAILTGTKTLSDETWTQYLADLDTAGYQKLHDEYQKMRVTTELMAEYSD